MKKLLQTLQKIQISQNSQQHLTAFFLYSLLAFALLSPTGSGHVIPRQQDAKTHIAAIVQGKMAMQEGQFILRTAPKEYHGWGYPKFQFYGPTLYFVTSLLYSAIAPDNPYVTFKIIIFISFLLGGFFIYRLSWRLTKHFSASVLSGFAYMAAPYFLIDAHWRNALAETLGLGILAVVLYYTIQLFLDKNFSIKNWLLTSFSWYFLMTVHLITFINSALFIGIFIILLSYKKNLIPLLRVATACAWACLLGAWFLAPIFWESSLLHIGRHLTETLMDSNWLTTLPRLLSITSMPSGLANLHPDHLAGPFYPAVGWPFLIGFTLCLFGVFAGRMKQNTALIIKLMFLFLLALFMAWSPVDFWQYLPKMLTVSQYSYRLLAQLIWISALLLAFALSMLLEEKRSDSDSNWLVIPLGILLIGLSSASWLELPALKTKNIHAIMQNPYLGYRHLESNYLISLNTSAIPPQAQLQPDISVKKVVPFCQRIHAITRCHLPESFSGGLTQFPVLYYPDNLIAVSLDNQQPPYFATHYYDPHVKKNQYMLVGLSLPPGKHIISFEFIGISWANKISCITLLLSGLLILGAVLLSFRRQKTTQSKVLA